MAFDGKITLSENPSIIYVRIAETLAHIWFDPNVIEMQKCGISNLAQEIGWASSGRVILRPDEVHNGLLQLYIAPGYTENYPETFQRILDSTRIILRVASSLCGDYCEDHSGSILPLEADDSANQT